MKLFTTVISILTVLACGACSTPSKYGLRSGSLSADSKDAIVVIKSNRFAREFYSLAFDQYDLDSESFLGDRFYLNFLMENSGFIFSNASPGDYTLSEIAVNQNWKLCPFEQTVSVEILLGTVNFIGVHDPRRHRRFSAETAKKLGHESLEQYRSVYYTEEVPAVTIREPGRSEILFLEKLIADELPGVTAPVVAQEVSEATYRAPIENKWFGLTCVND